MNKASLIAYADANLAARATVPSTLYVPPYYTDPAASEAAKAASAQDTYNIAAFARAYLYTRDIRYTNAISSILANWANTCASISTKDDTPLVVCYHWYKVFEAITLIGRVNLGIAMALAASIRGLTIAEILPAFQSISGNFNNWQSWSLLARAKLYAMQNLTSPTASENPATLKAQISTHLTRSTFNWPVISRKGEFWTENIRGNNALRYTHFSLAPLLLADRCLNGGEDFSSYISAFAGNCRNASGYYARYGTASWLGHLTKLFASSSATPELPDATSWSGEFFFYVSRVGIPVSVSDLYAAPATFNLGPGGELLYFVENDAELGMLA